MTRGNFGFYAMGLGLGLIFGMESGLLNLQGLILMGTGVVLVSIGISAIVVKK